MEETRYKKRRKSAQVLVLTVGQSQPKRTPTVTSADGQFLVPVRQTEVTEVGYSLFPLHLVQLP